MKWSIGVLFISLSLILTNACLARTITFSSTEKQNTLLELYTSEGCSSCPRADKWLSQLKQDSRLWNEVFPVAFHVDYWNYLGWKDRFSKHAYTQRQQAYANVGLVRTVYTPGFVKNGREWRSWFGNPNLDKLEAGVTGVLSATVSERRIDAVFQSAMTHDASVLHIAMLKMNESTAIRAGENEGKRLVHDFVVFHHLSANSSNRHWTVEDSKSIPQLADAQAIVFWVSGVKDPRPIQVTGGWLSQ